MFEIGESCVICAAVYAAFSTASARRVVAAKPSAARCLTAAAIAASCRAAVLAFAPTGATLAYIAAFLTISLVATEKRAGRGYLRASLALALFAVLCCGADAVLAGALGDIYAFAPLVVSPLCLIGYLAVSAICTARAASRRKRDYGAKVTIGSGECAVHCDGFWDSGNTLRLRGNMPVVVLDPSVADEVKPYAKKAGAIEVKTVCGTRCREVFFIDKMTVDDCDGRTVLRDVAAVTGERKFDGFSVLLNCGLHG